MDERTWLAECNPNQMAAYLRRSCLLSERCWRLLACACVRLDWQALADERLRCCVGLAERMADGPMPTASEIADADADARECWHTMRFAVSEATVWSVWRCLDASYLSAVPQNMAYRIGRERVAAVFRDVAGNPFSPYMATTCPRGPGAREWLRKDMRLHDWCRADGRQVEKLAAAAYNERLYTGSLDPVRLSILTDALEDVGCPQNDGVLTHLREPGDHVRGCWALDLLLIRRRTDEA